MKRGCEANTQRLKQDLERQLRLGPAELQRLRELGHREQETAVPHLARLATELAQAKADASVI